MVYFPEKLESVKKLTGFPLSVCGHFVLNEAKFGSGFGLLRSFCTSLNTWMLFVNRSTTVSRYKIITTVSEIGIKKTKARIK